MLRAGIVRVVAAKKERRIGGVPEGYDAFLLSQSAHNAVDPIVHICRDDARLDSLLKALAFFAPKLKVADFPAWDCLPYDRVSPITDIIARRITTLKSLINEANTPKVVLTTVSAVTQRLPPRSFIQNSTMNIAVGETVDRDALVQFFVRNGYLHAETVRETGEYAIRGGIIDIFCPGELDPLRLDFFGEQVESIRCFDAVTQRSKMKRQNLNLQPISEASLDKDSIALFRARYRNAFGVPCENDVVYEAVSAGQRPPGYEHWLPFFHKKLETLFDYLPNSALSFDHQWEHAFQERQETINDHYNARIDFLPSNLREATNQNDPVYRPIEKKEMFLGPADWEYGIGRNECYFYSPFEEGGETAKARASADFIEARQREDINLFKEVDNVIREAGRTKPVIIAAASVGSRDRLGKLITSAGTTALVNVDSWLDVKGMLKPNEAYITVWETNHGFSASELLVLSEEDILGERLARSSKRRRQAKEYIAEVGSLEVGDLVVHVDNGVGRYDGLESLTVDDAPHDCVRLIYAGEDRLFIPVENIDTLSRYGAEKSNAFLDRLGSVSWQARRAAVKERINDMADKLMKLAAERALVQAPAMLPPPGAYEEFSARFAWDETEDQLHAIEDVISDLGQTHAMDRLICGDVGFGKTEVAMRAAFVAASNGYQVAVVVPTTLLAFQHHETFKQRFAGLPIKISQLSRLVGSKDARTTKEQLKNGEVDVVVGTHALLAKDVQFNNIGLLVVDEEQHFGVSQKERLKDLRRELHVLTLTATPIPRTLQLALAGARDMSMIASPPVDRLAIRSFVLPFDPVVIREAINRERHRGGQIFYVCPRIADLERLEKRLSELAPDAKVVIAHGQMAPRVLETVINDFNQGKADILLSTNIIEAGIDIPNANTMLVHRADRFGLSQLYQLRGRIGRGKTRAYAYFTLPSGQILSSSAQKRLSVMQTLDTLGAGFTLASHDLDIRGAGNLLGGEQSGHIKEVGVELYQHMLEEAVAELQEEKTGVSVRKENWSPQISLGVAVLIPDEYVADLGLRLGLYRRLSRIGSSNEIEAFASELIDRFGPIPKPVENLLKVMEIKNLCRIAGVEKVDAGTGGASVVLRESRFANPLALVGYIQRHPTNVKLRPDQSLVFRSDWPMPDQRLDGVTKIARELADLATREAAEKTNQC